MNKNRGLNSAPRFYLAMVMSSVKPLIFSRFKKNNAKYYLENTSAYFLLLEST